MASAIIDEWSPLAYIQSLGGEDGKPPPHAPLYMPLSDQRRLRAYNVLQSFLSNTRRDYLPAEAHSGLDFDREGRPRSKAPEARQYREYGDPALVVSALRDLVLGESQEIVLPEDPGMGPPPEEIVDWVANWAKAERFQEKLLEGESKTCGLGDAVYVLGASTRAGRPKLRVEDPGFYFPDTQTQVEGWDDDDFPPIVHLLWEWEDTDSRRTVWVRRATWRMERLDRAVSTPWGSTREWTCIHEVVEWKRESLRTGATVYDDEMGPNGRVVTPRQDMMIDFIPVVHVPNTPDEWGQSILTLVAQLLDDLQSADSDLAVAAQTANPTMIVEGSSVPTLTGMPGEAVGLPEGARASYISANLSTKTDYLDGLMRRLAQNTRLGDVLLGRVAPNDVPSGYAMELGFHPARQIMRNARTVRLQKFPLIVKFAIRMAQAYGWLNVSGHTPRIDVTLGASLPSDKQTATTVVRDLLKARAISTRTAVTILQDAGFPIEDADAEIRLVRAENAEMLVKMVDALGPEALDYVRDALLSLEADTPPPNDATTAEPEADNTGRE